MKLLSFNKTNECPRRVGNTAHRTREGFFLGIEYVIAFIEYAEENASDI